MRYTNGYPNLSLAVIMASIERNGDCPCNTFMGAVEWNVNENPTSLTRLANDLKCAKEPITVITALHNNLFAGLNYVAGQYNSYNILSDADMQWEQFQKLKTILAKAEA